MIINYFGENYFKIQNNNFNILIDPINQRAFKGADIIIKTREELKALDSNFKDAVSNDFLLINHQGEFEKNDLRGRGWSVDYDKNNVYNIFLLYFDEMRIAIFSSLNKSLDENLKDYFIDLDIVLGLNDTSLIPFLKDLTPKIVILDEKNKKIDEFLKAFNQKEKEVLDKLVIRKKDLDFSQTKIICLKS